jgi:hypothetical protein
MTRRKKTRVVLALFVIIAGLLTVAGATPTVATAKSKKVSICLATNVRCHVYLSNSYGNHWVPIRYSTSNGVNPMSWVPSPTRFLMQCWAWGVNVRGNYSSTKWFYGMNWYNGQRGYVHSSYVINQQAQKPVPRC